MRRFPGLQRGAAQPRARGERPRARDAGNIEPHGSTSVSCHRRIHASNPSGSASFVRLLDDHVHAAIRTVRQRLGAHEHAWRRVRVEPLQRTRDARAPLLVEATDRAQLLAEVHELLQRLVDRIGHEVQRHVVRGAERLFVDGARRRDTRACTPTAARTRNPASGTAPACGRAGATRCTHGARRGR